jgi:hypothetical protein
MQDHKDMIDGRNVELYFTSYFISYPRDVGNEYTIYSVAAADWDAFYDYIYDPDETKELNYTDAQALRESSVHAAVHRATPDFGRWLSVDDTRHEIRRAGNVDQQCNAQG